MFCHGELARPQARCPPPDRLLPDDRTGGALGGVLVGVVAPLLFRGTLELPLAIAACAGLLIVAHRHEGRPSLALAAATGGIVRSQRAGMSTITAAMRSRWSATSTAACGSRSRNAGTDFESRVLVHGTVAHGVQFTDPVAARRAPPPTTARVPGPRWRCKSTGERPVRVGLVGLGVGTLAAYSRPGDVYRFYEINPLVETLARSEFTFLADAAATVAVVPGDARLALEREADQRYDVLLVDAFSGDAVPAHLLTHRGHAPLLPTPHARGGCWRCTFPTTTSTSSRWPTPWCGRSASTPCWSTATRSRTEIFGAKWVLVALRAAVDPGDRRGRRSALGATRAARLDRRLQQPFRDPEAAHRDLQG